MDKISINSLIIKYKWKISLTFILVIIDSLLYLFFPLFIGFAINDLLVDKYTGIYQLAGLGVLSLLAGSARRFYDTRIYSSIYTEVASSLVEKEERKGSSVSKTVARTNLLREFIEFLEESMPEIVGGIVSIFGIIVIVFSLNENVAYACISMFFLLALTYTASGKLNYQLNARYNDKLEEMVDSIGSKNRKVIKGYFGSLMKWNIKLSDLETINFAVIWVGIIALFIYTPISVIDSGVVKYGLVFSVLIYVFDYIDNVVDFPLHIQQLIRLHEISNRLK